MSREEQEKIETISRKKCQIRTAVEFDPKEMICWTSIYSELTRYESITSRRELSDHIDSETQSFPGDGDSEGIFIPNDTEIASLLRSEVQSAIIWDTRELLVNFGATENDLRGALRSLEMHLTTNACEYDEVSRERVLRTFFRMFSSFRSKESQTILSEMWTNSPWKSTNSKRSCAKSTKFAYAELNLYLFFIKTSIMKTIIYFFSEISLLITLVSILFLFRTISTLFTNMYVYTPPSDS